MQKLVTVQRKNGTIEEMPDWMANDTRLQKKHGWRVINIPTTVEELKPSFMIWSLLMSQLLNRNLLQKHQKNVEDQLKTKIWN